MAGGRKAKWRKVPVTAAERMLDEAPIKERVEERLRKNELFTLDAEGRGPPINSIHQTLNPIHPRRALPCAVSSLQSLNILLILRFCRLFRDG